MDDKPLFESSSAKKSEPAFLNLVFNVMIPVLVLNHGARFFSPTHSLFLALAFPLIYGVRDYRDRKHINAFSILGLLNVSITGGFALAGLNGFWFAVKEAAFPLLIGIFVLGSAWSSKPFIKMMFFQPQLFHLEKLEASLKMKQRVAEFRSLLKTSTQLLAASFFLSAGLNFWLALRVFSPIESHLSELQKQQLLNEQIAQMTSSSLVIIMLPSVLSLMALLFYLMSRISKLAEEPASHFMKQ
ncbi:MAG: VC0807 family protein [Bdellovibrio sp.]